MVERRDIATIEPLVNTDSNAFENLVHRLDDGNAYPGFFLEYNEDGTYTLYEEGV